MSTARVTSLLIATLATVAPVRAQCPSTPQAARVQEKEIESLLEAIRDEIYAEELQGYYHDLAYRIPVYVQPCRKNALIWVVYRFMPIGEVLRAADRPIGDTLIILLGDRANMNATNGSAMPTVFLDDDKLIDIKTTFARYLLDLELRPSAATVNASRQRQLRRDRLKEGRDQAPPRN